MTQAALVDAAGLAPDRLVSWLRQMLLIRRFEEVGVQLTLRGWFAGGMHPAIGQEAVAVGTAAALTPQDAVAATHRDHHHALAAGLDPNLVMAELFGKANGVVGGRGGSMHLADVKHGFLGGNGIVGAGVGIAMGAALAAKLKGDRSTAVGFVGDGGLNTGRTWESANLAGAWQLPLVVICENNMYAVETLFSSVTSGGSPVARAAGFGLAAEEVDGQDVVAMYRAVAAARERAANGGGPSFIEARTYRYTGHGAGEPANYRTEDEVDEWRSTRDPIQRLAGALVAQGELTEEHLERLRQEATAAVDEAVRFAEQSPEVTVDEENGQ